MLNVTVNTQSITPIGPTGNVTFKAGNTTLGTASLTFISGSGTTGASAAALLNTSFSTPGVQSLTVIYGGDSNYAGSTSPAVNVTVTSIGSFTMGGSAVTLNSATGTGQPSTITLTPSGGFTGAVMVSCPATLPPGVTCPNSPLTITVPSNGTSATGQLNLAVVATSTTLSASVAQANREFHVAGLIPQRGAKGWWGVSGGVGIAAILLLLVPGRRRYRGALGLSLLCVLSFALGCGGGSGGGGGGGGPVATTTKLTVANAKVASGNTFSFSAAVTGGSPSGQIQLVEGGSILAAATVSGGTASFQTAALPVGTHSVSAHYLGDANTLASSSGTLNVTVTGTTSVAITTNPAATPAAAPITLTIN